MKSPDLAEIKDMLQVAAAPGQKRMVARIVLTASIGDIRR